MKDENCIKFSLGEPEKGHVFFLFVLVNITDFLDGGLAILWNIIPTSAGPSCIIFSLFKMIF